MKLGRRFRRILAIQTARRLDKALSRETYYYGKVHTLGLFRGAKDGIVLPRQQVERFEDHVQQRLKTPNASVVVTKERVFLNIIATVNPDPDNR